MYHQIERCRVCGSVELESLLHLGNQHLTGVFPCERDARVTSGPLELVRCKGECGLVQLHHTFDHHEMYGANYGYRSGLNQSMVRHLHEKAQGLLKVAPFRKGDVVLDIGSNDGTLLGFYPPRVGRLIGIDPTSEKFRRHYRSDIDLVTDFFPSPALDEKLEGRKARIITSIAMFYDLEDPLSFMRAAAEALAEDGIWHFEQSYLPSMLLKTAYDTICHEHLEYYALRQVIFMAREAGLKVLNVELNEVNGGSFAVTAARGDALFEVNQRAIDRILASEAELDDPATFAAFAQRVERHRDELLKLLGGLKSEGKRVLGYGASTKGNVILQYCGITPDLLPAIAEVNPDKFGCFTPGTNIPIISEAQAHEQRPDYLLVLPWHFRENLIAREAKFLERGGKMIFPLPKIEIYP
jgi:hypothetical protein